MKGTSSTASNKIRSGSVDLVIRNVRLPIPGPPRRDAVIHKGAFVAFPSAFHGSATREVDAREAWLLPGFVDAHVHFNEPGRTFWEGISTGSSALAAGGGTTFFDMPLNSSPPALAAGDLKKKRSLAKRKSLVDFALWGGLVPGNEDQIAGLAQAGAVGIKCFLCPSGLADFPATDRRTLCRGAAECARAGLVLGVHAEDPALCTAPESLSPDDPDWLRFCKSRPEEAEVSAIRECLRVAEETGCRMHIVHVSAPEGLALIAEGARKGIDISAEVCPHHLLLEPSLMETKGAAAKCAPPLRPAKTRALLWKALKQGLVLSVGSDHSPCLPSRKTKGNLFEQWGGISGASQAMRFFLDAARDHRIPWRRIISLTSIAAAQRFGIPRKGGLQPECDADFVLLREGRARKVREVDLHTRHPISPYVGLSCRWEIQRTFVRGREVFSRGKFALPGHAIDLKEPNHP